MKTNLKNAALEIIARAYAEQPELKLAIGARSGNACSCIGAWDEARNRYIPVAAPALTGEWFSLRAELLLDGQPMSHAWTPVANHA